MSALHTRAVPSMGLRLGGIFDYQTGGTSLASEGDYLLGRETGDVLPYGRAGRKRGCPHPAHYLGSPIRARLVPTSTGTRDESITFS
jgi:hypothetical protein